MNWVLQSYALSCLALNYILGSMASLSNHTYIDNFLFLIFKICDTGRVGERWNSNFNHVLHAWNKSSEDFAQEHISNLINQTWKKMNKDWVYNFPFEKLFLETTINLSRISHCTYIPPRRWPQRPKFQIKGPSSFVDNSTHTAHLAINNFSKVCVDKFIQS